MKKLFIILILFIVSLFAQQNKTLINENIPHLKKHGSTYQLIVNGKPLLMLGGETGNSSASDLKYMDTIWQKIVKMHLNTLLVPVYWELIESKEDEFFIPSIPGLIYAVNKDSLYINLFISDKAELLVDGQKIEISQQDNYPWNGNIDISINPEREKTFTLKVRIPGWAQNQAVPGNLYSYANNVKDKVRLKVNGKEEKITLDKGYAEIYRKWTKGDRVELALPMTIHKVFANEKVIDDNNKVAFEYGPMVYCAEEIDNKQISKISTPDNVDLNPTEETLLSNKIIAIEGKANSGKFKLIPYYLWSNRGVGKMKVWFLMKNEI